MILLLLLWIFPFLLADPYSFHWDSGGYDYSCDGLGSGWQLAGESCFYPYSAISFNFSTGGAFCRNRDLHFAVAAIVDNWLVAGSLRSRVEPRLYWTGVSLINDSSLSLNPLNSINSVFNPLWAVDQPPNQKAQTNNCVALDLTSSDAVGWRLMNCSEQLPVLCQTFACLPDKWRCLDNSRCIPASAYHDGFRDCLDGSDESSNEQLLSRFSSQTDCRHVLMRGSGEFSSPQFPDNYPQGSTCRWDLEASDGKTVAFTIDGYEPSSFLSVNGDSNPIELPWDETEALSTRTDSRLVTVRLRSTDSGKGFRVRFHSAEKTACTLVDGVADYDSFSTPFDCSFQAVAPITTQFLLFIAESMNKSSSASVNVTGAGYSFGFSGTGHNQAVVIPSSEVTLTVQDAWRSQDRTIFRIRVIPFGSTCLVIPLTVGSLSLHWPCQPVPTFVPHCLSFAFVGHRKHTWRVDNLVSSKADTVGLTAKTGELGLSSACTYRDENSVTLNIKQLSPEFTMSFKVSQDCDWPSGSFSFGSEVACVEGSPAESSECLMGGQWSVDPDLCLSTQTLTSELEISADHCVLPWLKTSYPIAANYSQGGKLTFTCRPTYFPDPQADCDASTGICSVNCTHSGEEYYWNPSPECLLTQCDRPVVYKGASPIISSSDYYFGLQVFYEVPEGKKPNATAYAICDYQHGQIYKPGWSFYGFQFVDQICLSFPILYGSFVNQTYAYGENGTIICISGYALQGTTVCKDGSWTNPNIFCDYIPLFESKCQPGNATVLNGTTVCSCPDPYVAVGSPNNQTCTYRNPCQDGTNLCDPDAICYATPWKPRGYECQCPYGKVIWSNSSQNGLLQGISCSSECTLANINLLPDQYLHGYQDPPGDQPYWVYCERNVSSLGYEKAYIKAIKSHSQCEGMWDDACTVPCRTAGASPLSSVPYPSYPYDRVDNSCPIGYILIGPKNSVCGLQGNFFDWKNEQEVRKPLCHMPQCSRLDVLFPNNYMNSTSPNGLPFALNATVYLRNCAPDTVTCTLDIGNRPAWNTSFLNCSTAETTQAYASTLGSTSTIFGSTSSFPSTSFGPTSASSLSTFGSTLRSTTDSLGSSSQSMSTKYFPWTVSTQTRPSNRTTRLSSRTTALAKPWFPTVHPPDGSDMSDCTDDLNNCSNGHCNTITKQCECLEGFYPDADGLQCIQIPNYGIWCSEGEVQDNGTCSCKNGFGTGAYSDSSLCMDGPSTTCPDSQSGFTPNDTDWGSLLQKCFKVFNKTLLIDGDSGSKCQCVNGACAGTMFENSLPCICNPGYAGELCDVSLACQNVICQNGGTCKHGICHCLSGWDGIDCSQLIIHQNCLPHNDCSPSTSICHTTYNGTFCLCDAGYTGTLCDVPIDYCSYTNPCVSGDCHNAPDNIVGVICDCQSSYQQPYCDTPLEEACQSSSCGKNQCIELIYPDYVCNCEDNNYKPLGSQPDNCAETVSYCTPELSPCFNQGTCTDTYKPGQHGYTCNCTGEYDGTWCQQDLCFGVVCVNGICLQAGNCQCDPGWTGSHCESPIPCNLPCEHAGTCQLDGANNPYCNCTDSWTGSLCTKSKINCTNTCQHGICYHDSDGFYCNCTSAYDGANCDQLKSCSEMGFVCENGGTCRVTEDGNKNCTCPTGVHGDSCETLGTRCTPTLCLNGATCQEDIFLNARCICTENYEGEYCQTKRDVSFDLLWTGYPSNQDFVSSQLNTSLYREFTLCGWVQYAPSVPATSSTPLPPFMGIRTSTNLHVLTVDNLGVLIDNTRIMNVSIPTLQWHHVCVIAPVYNTGRQTWTYFLDGMPVRNSTYQVLPQNSVTLYMVSLAPGNQFQGELSLVQLFFERLNDTQIASMAFNCANTTYDFGNSPLLISWDKNFTTLDRSNPGVIQVQPGICDISNCLPGRPCGTVDKIPPVVTFCPGPIRLVSAQKFTTVSWTAPTFKDNVAVATVTNNFRPGQLFPWGYYQVIYVAKDAASNSVTCQFPVVVAPTDCLTEDPPGGRVERLNVKGTNSQMVVRLTCMDEAFPKTDPEFFVCDDLGQWDRISSFSLDRPYSFPSCGNTTYPTQTINGTVTGNGTSCDDIYNKLSSTLSNATSSVCSDAKCFEIYPQCSDVGKVRKRGIINDFTQFFEYRIIVNNTRDMLQSSVQNSVKNTFPDGQPTSDAYFDCDPEFPCGKPDDNQYSCANCAPGTWWDVSKNSCVDCPPDSYRMHPPINACVPCDVGKTTGGLSKVASIDGCYKNCSVGYYYSSSANDCRPCSPGTYQPDTGRTECLTCPLYTSTFGEGRTNKEDCTNTCEPGKEFESNMVNCTDCPIGTYKNGTNTSCMLCDTGRTTANTGSKISTDCDVVWCPPGTRVSPNLTLPLPPPGQGRLYSFCPLCEMGTYSTDYNQTVCMNCTDQDQAPSCALSSECAPSFVS